MCEVLSIVKKALATKLPEELTLLQLSQAEDEKLWGILEVRVPATIHHGDFRKNKCTL